MTDNSKKDAKDKINKESSADGVTQYLQTLTNNDGAREQLYCSQEQDFSAEELSKIINEARLNELLAHSDAFLNSLSSEIKDFDEDNIK